MKTIQCLIIAFLFSTRLFSQDTLYTKEGNLLAGKVMEITKDDIKYKRASNPDGPMYVISKSDVVMIEYKNGAKDVFSKPANTNDANTQANNNNNNNLNYSQSGNTVYVTPRPTVNVVVGGSPYFGYNPWGWSRGWGWGGGYRSYGSYRGYHGGYGGYHGGGGGHYGHHR